MANLEYRYGPMNSGKSMAVLQMAYNYEENGKKVLLVKSVVDTKGGDYLVSRIGPKRKIQIKLEKTESLLDPKYVGMIEDKNAILVDEAQFLTTKQVEDLWYISKKMNISVICFGLKTNFKSEFFDGSKRLFELADKFKELETICKCGTKARFNARMVDGKFITEGQELVIDEVNRNVKYVPLCGKCYLEKVFSGKNKKNQAN